VCEEPLDLPRTRRVARVQSREQTGDETAARFRGRFAEPQDRDLGDAQVLDRGARIAELLEDEVRGRPRELRAREEQEPFASADRLLLREDALDEARGGACSRILRAANRTHRSGSPSAAYGSAAASSGCARRPVRSPALRRVAGDPVRCPTVPRPPVAKTSDPSGANAKVRIGQPLFAERSVSTVPVKVAPSGRDARRGSALRPIGDEERAAESLGKLRLVQNTTPLGEPRPMSAAAGGGPEGGRPRTRPAPQAVAPPSTQSEDAHGPVRGGRRPTPCRCRR
jgi:hypothetical protein